TWGRGAEIQTAWPVVSTLAEPVLLAVGGYAFVQQGGWQSYRVGQYIRRVVGDAQGLYILAAGGILRSTDGGQTWAPLEDLPAGTLADIACDSESLYLLTTDGMLWAHNRS
ncbi:MAG: hypothetical protein K8I30_12435, partial [Anaerolineae bacterium]|nr:hypothetical protein [Anaerolineae bacterium]